ncbi:MAG: tRNA pseudouridine(55) synthase TruB [Bacteroides sp. CAG:1060_57_27]|nr:MAG: tRNA pseudouridine(55) synthase TruB [Bacteroides sp. CAG:1060_57_27]
MSADIADYPEGIVLPVDKPYRWTSADVVRKLKYAAIRHFGKKNLKVGHAGTLDPLATGILLVCIGPATKRAEELQASRKQYVAEVSFGATTPSYDLEKGIDREYSADGVCREVLERLLPSFVGEQMQVAPLFSAKSVDGVRAYETARRLLREGKLDGIPDMIQANPVTVYSIVLEDFSLKTFSAPESDPSARRINVADFSGRTFPTATLRIDCSKGTYIRALARDLGEALGSGAFLSSLRRTVNGGFGIGEALSLGDALAMFGA